MFKTKDGAGRHFIVVTSAKAGACDVMPHAPAPHVYIIELFEMFGLLGMG
ncbi:hypothetical protein U370_02035 [Anaplasma marginale str. Dawn]|nr:hypothetical protein U370_02035 [Anaplasma marginale str. Dawn]